MGRQRVQRLIQKHGIPARAKRRRSRGYGRPLKQLEANTRPKDACAGQHDVSVRNSLDPEISVEQCQNKIRAHSEPLSSGRCDLSHQNSGILGRVVTGNHV